VTVTGRRPAALVSVLMAAVSLVGASCASGAKPAAVGAISFSDVTSRRGLDGPLTGMYVHAAAVGDVNADGNDDLFVGSFASYPDANYLLRGATRPSPDRLLLGGRNRFSVDSTFPTLIGRTSAALFADLDNSGYPELLVVRYTMDKVRNGAAPTVVLHNDDGYLTAPRPLPLVQQGRDAVAFDYDNDGILDLFVTRDDYFGAPNGSSVLLRGKGKLQFEDRTAAAGLGGVIGYGTGVGDLNGDGWPDLVAADTSPVQGEGSSPAARLFLNNHDGTFHEISNADFVWATHGLEDHVTSAIVTDLNRDGRLDVVIGQHFETATTHPTQVRAYLNTPDASPDGLHFRDITAASGIPAFPGKAPDVQVTDFDNDGLVDLVATGASARGTRPAVFRNTGLVDGVPRYEQPAGMGGAAYWLNAALLDVDHDGRVDLFATHWEPNRPSLLLHNDSRGGHWLEVRATGAGGGVGSRVEVYRSGAIGDPAALLGAGEIGAAAGAGTGSKSTFHVGVGAVTRVDVRVRAPGNAPWRVAEDVGADQTLRL
jgi:hypothetical protein